MWAVVGWTAPFLEPSILLKFSPYLPISSLFFVGSHGVSLRLWSLLIALFIKSLHLWLATLNKSLAPLHFPSSQIAHGPPCHVAEFGEPVLINPTPIFILSETSPTPT